MAFQKQNSNIEEEVNNLTSENQILKQDLEYLEMTKESYKNEFA